MRHLLNLRYASFWCASALVAVLGVQQLRAQNVPWGYPIQLTANDRRVPAWAFLPFGKGPFPGLVLVHERRGVTEWIKSTAARLSVQGYAVVVPDLYDGVLARDDQQVEWANSARARGPAVVQAAAKYLKSRPDVRADRVGLIGFCMGGTIVLTAAPQDDSLAAVVAYYGLPAELPSASRIRAPVLGIYGEADEAVPLAKAKELQALLTSRSQKTEFFYYPRAPHAFANSTLAQYQPEAAADAWEKVTAFLKATLVQ